MDNSTISGDRTPIHPSVYIISASFIILVSITGIVGNGLTILSVFLSAKLRTKTNVFVVNLAFGDLLVCLCIPVQAVTLLSPREPPMSDILIQLIGVVGKVLVSNTIFTLAVIAFMRCVKITKPLGLFDDLFTTPRIATIVAGSWALSAMITTMIFFLGGRHFRYDSDARLFSPSAIAVSKIAAVACHITDGAYVVLSILIIFISYIKIIVYLRANTRRIAALVDVPPAALRNQPPIALQARNQGQAARQERPNQMAENRFRAREVKVTKNLALVTAVFLVSFLPLPFVPNRSNPYLLIFDFCLIWSNSAINPLIYAFRHADFRKVYRCILSRSFKDIPFPSRQLRAMLPDQ
ncbi:probable G-protein coupled receptor No18 [Lytechinus variegatus]|uniref:probable G-protein coupled receptor No18 n=1 Tax=Lytechinus variegatus TaxID=7654 RepID=UPI001BB210C8|nr:probable G-protein coupled receptor No18 [Lytechinus variegatus]